MHRLVETRHVSASSYREVSLPGSQQSQDDPCRWLFLPQSTGGILSLPGSDSRQLHWHLQSHTVSALALADISVTSGQIGRGLQLQIPDQVFPAVAAHVDNNSICIYLLLASKSVAVLKLPAPAAAAGQRGTSSSSSSSVLDAVGQGLRTNTWWSVVPLAAELSNLGLPSALTVADGSLCIAGSSGAVACIPLDALAAGQGQGSVAYLHPNTLVAQVRRRMGFATSTGAVAALPVDIPAAQHSSLLVVHKDASCHQWFVGQQRQGFSSSLVSDASYKQLKPNRVVLCKPQPRHSASRPPPWDVLLVFDVQVVDGGASSDIRVLPMQLQQQTQAQQTPRSAAAAASKLEPLLSKPKPLQLEWPDASLLDARVIGQQLLLLCSATSGGTFVVGYSIKDWSYQGRCQLLQQKAGEWGAHEELWSAALAVFPDAIDPASHVLSQMLVPGQLCGATLVQTLSYFGTQLSEAELAVATPSRLQACIKAAVEVLQAKNPSFSAARCWHALFAKYCELWQQQHAVLGLWTDAAGWVGAVRAGGLLTVLRTVTPAEVLSQESTPAVLEDILQAVGASGTSGIPGGAADVAKVRLCMEAISQVLGQPALRVMTQLAMAGVPVESQLLPAFVQLILQGPPLQPQQQQLAAAALAGRGGFGLDGSDGGVQQRLLKWRLQRQAHLLTIHEHLADLSHALETITGVVELTIKTATLAAEQLEQPVASAAIPTAARPPAALSSLLSSVALHSLRASCMSLQQLLLLVGCIRQLGSVGSVHLVASDQAAMIADQIAPLATALRSAAVALWLCKTPASVPVAGAAAAMAGVRGNTGLPGPLLGLRNPTPSSSAASTPRDGGTVAAGFAASAHLGASGLSTAPGALSSWHFPLAAHLLPDFWHQQQAVASTAGASLGQLGAQLSVWLMLGAGAAAAIDQDQDTSSVLTQGTWDSTIGRSWGHSAASGSSLSAAYQAVTTSASLAGRAVLLGYQLFAAQEYAAMQWLVKLVAGDSPSEPGLQFVLGLSIACSLKQDRKAAAAAVAGGGGGGSSRLAGPGSPGPDAARRADAAPQLTHHAAVAAAAQLDTAVGHLFRAAAGLCSAEAGPLRLVLQLLRQQQRSSYSKGPAAATAATAMEVDAGDGLQPDQLEPAAAAAAAAASQPQHDAVLRLQFAEAVMLLFEQTGVKEGALAFARAALGAVEAAYGPAEQQQQEKLQHQAMLWTNIFNFALDLGATWEAYAAALSNPRHDTSEKAVRRLVQTLIDQGELQQLLSLPWAGVLQLERNKLLEPVPVVEIVIDRLVNRARLSDHRSHCSAYYTLYDFLVSRGNYKHAAAAMLSLARRLRVAGAAAAVGGSSGAAGNHRQEQLVLDVQAAYDACVTLLQVLAPADAWLDTSQPLLVSLAAPAPSSSAGRQRTTVTAAAAARDAMDHSADSPFYDAPRAADTTEGKHLHRRQQQQMAPVALSLADVRQESILFAAAAALLATRPGLDIWSYGLAADYIYEQLLGQGMFPEALQLAHALWSGLQLADQLEVATAALGASCAELQQSNPQQALSGNDSSSWQQWQQGGSGNGALHSLLGDAGVLEASVLSQTGPGYLGSSAAAAWSKLQQLLELYDGFDCLSAGVTDPDTAAICRGSSTSAAGSSSSGCISIVGGRMRVAAVDGALGVQPAMRLPAWLLQPFQPVMGKAGGMAGQAADPAELLRVYMKHGRLVDAAQLVQSHLEAWQSQVMAVRQQPAAVWLPLLDLELLHAKLEAGVLHAKDAGRPGDAETLGRCADMLREGLSEYIKLVQSDSAQLTAPAPGSSGFAGGFGMRL